jgi:hypothetical protein
MGYGAGDLEVSCSQSIMGPPDAQSRKLAELTLGCVQVTGTRLLRAQAGTQDCPRASELLVQGPGGTTQQRNTENTKAHHCTRS